MFEGSFCLERDKIVIFSYLIGCYVEVKHFKYLQKTDLGSFFVFNNKVVDFRIKNNFSIIIPVPKVE